MKKIFLYTLALVATFATFSCSDKDEEGYSASSYRLVRPIFRTNLTVSNGSNDPYLCKLVGGENGNSIQLYWSRVNGAKACEGESGDQCGSKDGAPVYSAKSYRAVGEEGHWKSRRYLANGGYT